MESRSASPPQQASLAEAFPALAHALGAERFDALCRRAQDEAGGAGQPPGALMERLVTRMVLCQPERDRRFPGRLLADVAALEWATARVAATPPSEDRPLRLDDLPADAGARGLSSLVPIAALAVVPVAFRLDAWLRRVHQGRRPPPPPRGDQCLVVHRPYASVGRMTLQPRHGRLLSLLIMGATLAEARAAARAHAWVADDEKLDALIIDWIGEGFFAQVRPPDFAGRALA